MMMMGHGRAAKSVVDSLSTSIGSDWLCSLGSRIIPLQREPTLEETYLSSLKMLYHLFSTACPVRGCRGLECILAAFGVKQVHTG